MRTALLLLLALPAAAAPVLDYAAFARLHARLLGHETAQNLEDTLPHLRRDLAIARKTSTRWWTDCALFDELAKAEILDETVMKGLGIRRDVTDGVAHAPAGVMHTYGYLFSQLRTAYGLKGKRWLESRLDERLGLPAGTFSPAPPGGEFLANVTSALLELIGAPGKVARAAKLHPAAKAAGRVEQRVTWTTPAGKTVAASVSTYLAPLPPLPGLVTTDEFLLIYAVYADGRHRLTTAFPVGREFAEKIMSAKPDKERAFKPRYNLYINPSWTVASQENLGWRAN